MHTTKKDEEECTWECPILNKAFSDHSKIVAIKISKNEANVYSYDAVHELNIKLKNYEDLITGKKFNMKKDMIILQDPNDVEHEKLRDICNFHHTNNNIPVVEEDSKNIRGTTSIMRVMDKLADNQNKRKLEQAQKTQEQPQNDNKQKIYACDITGRSETIGKCSGSFTSTSLNITSQNNTYREATQEEILEGQLKMLSKLKKKGYVRLHTTCGTLDVELHCDLVPRTTFNFLSLCKEGKYNKSPFHRLIPGFMAQVGKPSIGDEGSSIWGKPFKDEFHHKLTHEEKGVLSMANAGPNTNNAQFFITFKHCIYLDNKHGVFGKVIKGLDVLDIMEQIPTHTYGKRKDSPKKDICIESVDILVNPVEEAVNLEEERVLKNYEMRMKGSMVYDDSMNKKAKIGVVSSDGVGKYLPKRLNSLKKK